MMEKQALLVLIVLGLFISVVVVTVIFSNNGYQEQNTNSADGQVNFYVKGNPEPQTDKATVKFNVIKRGKKNE